MDANTLNRREKRHYRKVVDGEIVYTTSPVDDISEDYSDVKPEKIKVAKVVPTNISLDKKELMNKVLDNMSEVINPDMDSIADAIYEQLKENNIDVEKKVVKNVVTKHYRASTGTVTSSSTEESDEGFDSSIDRDKLKLVVDDLYVQIENENKTEELNKAKEKVVLENIKKEKDKEKEQATRPKETSKKTKEQEKPIKKNDISKLLQEDDLDLSDDEDSEDDLGLKF